MKLNHSFRKDQERRPGPAFDAAHHSAVKANKCAGEDNLIVQEIEQKELQLAELDQRLSPQQVIFFTLGFFVVAVCEMIASWEFYKIFLKGHFDLGFVQIPFAFFGAAAVVLAGVLISHSLRTLFNKQIADYELYLTREEHPDLPDAALQRQVRRTRQIQHTLGVIALLVCCTLLIWFSHLRVVWEGKAAGKDISFTALDASPALFLILESLLGIFFFSFLKRQALVFSIWRLKRRSEKLRNICREETHQVAAAVYELDKLNFDWKSDNEIQIAMLRFTHRNSSDDEYTKLIKAGKNHVFIRDKQGKAVSDVKIIGITEFETPTHGAVTDINGAALLNYMDAEALKSIWVNGEQFDGYFPNGTATTLVIETKRPIGF
ncbi:MAG: hypothetical protein JNM22_06385 [Saprospiraceae bacterium]|nr:hypothetical protein [Saprospiraceae bacterium]